MQERLREIEAKYAELERKMVLELPEEEEISVSSAAALSNKLLQLANGAVYAEARRVHEVHGCKIEAFLELVESLRKEIRDFTPSRDPMELGEAKRGRELVQARLAQFEAEWEKEDTGYFGTTPFFLVFIDRPARARKQYYSYPLMLFSSFLKDKARTARYAAEQKKDTYHSCIRDFTVTD